MELIWEKIDGINMGKNRWKKPVYISFSLYFIAKLS